MIVYKRDHQLDIEEFKDRLLFDYGFKHFRFFREGGSLIRALGMTEFRFDIIREKPLLYIKMAAPYVLQPDRIIVKAENQIEANELIDAFIFKYHLESVGDRKPENIEELLRRNEDQDHEFKSTLRYDLQRNKINADLEKACLKTICAFLNAGDGILLIGVSDDKRVVGLSHDFQTFEKKDRDGFENHLTNQISSKIGNPLLGFIDISFHIIEKKEVCKVRVNRSSEPAFFREGGRQEFYVRTGNNSRPFSMSEALDYIKERWEKY